MKFAPVELSASALELLPFMALILDADLLVHHANAAARDRLQPPEDETAQTLEFVLGRSGQVPSDVRRAVISHCRTMLAGQAPHDAVIPAGPGHAIEFHARPLGHVRWLVILAERKGREDPRVILDEQYRDGLTGLGNQRHLDTKSAEALVASTPGQRPAIIVLDIDRFADVNERLGWDGGNELLRAMAGRLWGATRAHDQIVRLDADLFAVLQIAGEGTDKLAGRLVRTLNRPYMIRGEVLTLSVSAGYARASGDGMTAGSLRQSALLAWREAKNAGGNTWRRFAQSPAERMNARGDLAADLRDAVVLEQLSLAYQPKVNLRSNAISGFEALARWHHPSRGTLQPRVFIPIAEETGSIHEVGPWALRRACEDASRWPAHLTVAVNISPRQLEDGWRFLTQVTAILNETGLPPHRLELEFEETALIQNPEGTRSILNGLRDLGVRIALDDFGSGPASLRNIRGFSFDAVKIDQSFISMMEIEPDAVTVIQAIATLGKGLNMTVIAQGVESQRQAEIIAQTGCTEIQGFLISEPVHLDDVENALSRDQVLSLSH
jgi:diguanylate cyclase (GGDEF)-like protein